MSTFNVTHPLKFTSHTRKQPNHLTLFFCLIFSVTNSHSHPHNLPLSSQWISTFFGNSSHVHSLNICSTLILNGTKPREKKLISAFHVNIFGAENSMRIIMREKIVFTFQPTARNYYYIKIYMWKGSKWICFVCSSLKWTPPYHFFFSLADESIFDRGYPQSLWGTCAILNLNWPLTKSILSKYSSY